MDVKNVEKKENGKLAFQVEVDGASFEKAVNAAYLKAKKDIYVPGFRKGKAPRMVIEGMYGAEVFYEDAIEALAPQAYEAGVAASEEKTVGAPSITNYNVGEDKTLTLDFEVALYPEVTLGQYKGLEIVKNAVEVSEEEIAAELEKEQKKGARIASVEREAAMGDTANIDFEGFKEGVAFDGGKGENHDLVLGSGSFVPGFEEQVVGMKAGEEKDIDITFPENYHEDLAGAAVVFHVKVNEVKETILPELDDEFAKDVSEFDTLDEYKASIKAELETKKQAEADRAFNTAALEKAVENMSVEVPEVMVDEQVDNVVNDYAQNISSQGIPFDQYLGMMGMDLAGFRAMVRPSAAQEVRTQLFLEKLSQVEEIAVSDEEIETEFTRVSELYGMELDQLKASVDSELVARDIKLRKAAELVANSAVATEAKAEAETEAQAE